MIDNNTERDQRRREVRIGNFVHVCKHFRRGVAIVSHECALGIKLADVALGGRTSWKDGEPPVLPCQGFWSHEKHIGTVIGAPTLDTCPKREMPTRGEGEAHFAADEAMFRHMAEARHAIVEAANLRRENGHWKADRPSGAVPCPACGKSLGYSASTYNGHVHARCETPDCIAWME